MLRVKMRGDIMKREMITTQSVRSGFARIREKFVLEDKPRTKTVFEAEIHSGGIRGRLIRYRKDHAGNCEEIIPLNFNQLHENEGVKIELHTEAVALLYRKFEELSRLLEQKGVPNGEHSFSIIDANSIIITDDNKATIIRKLLEKNYGEDVWIQLDQDNPDIASKLANAKVQSDRMKVLDQFKVLLENETLEKDWQDFFEDNTWIFGYGLRYQILRVVQTQPNYGGTTVTGSGGQRGDFLTCTEAEVKFTCLVEIKKPNTTLLQTSEYRNGAWGVSADLSGAVSQVQINCAMWENEGSRTDANRDIMSEVNTVSPKGIVIIGNTSQLDDRNKRNSFERFRAGMNNPEVITFDELYNRAVFIVGELEQPEIEPQIADNIPF